MKRLELFEFEDFDGLPDFVRTGVTNLIMVFHKLLGTADILSTLILKVRKNTHFNQVVDMGSGSGGAMLECFSKLQEMKEGQSLNLLLTDLYPNANVVDSINNRRLKNIQYSSESVNATDISEAPAGLKTMIASFHHMRPEVAKKILQSAEAGKEPILIYELAKNNIPTILWWILLPISLIILFLMALVMTFFVRPLTFTQIIFTFLIPIIPIVYAWDGQASLMRTYTFEDIQELLNQDESSKYKWEVADAKNSKGKNQGYYIMGFEEKIGY